MKYPLYNLLLTSQDMVNRLEGSLEQLGSTVISFIKGVFDNMIVPLAIVALLGVIFFELFKAGAARNRQRGEEFEDHVRNLLILVVILVIVGSYGTFAWGLI